MNYLSILDAQLNKAGNDLFDLVEDKELEEAYQDHDCKAKLKGVCNICLKYFKSRGINQNSNIDSQYDDYKLEEKI